jgi:hypothetical protein
MRRSRDFYESRAGLPGRFGSERGLELWYFVFQTPFSGPPP